MFSDSPKSVSQEGGQDQRNAPKGAITDHIFSSLYHDLQVFLKGFSRNDNESKIFGHLLHGVF